jgi:hypothetical protein
VPQPALFTIVLIYLRPKAWMIGVLTGMEAKAAMCPTGSYRRAVCDAMMCMPVRVRDIGVYWYFFSNHCTSTCILIVKEKRKRGFPLTSPSLKLTPSLLVDGTLMNKASYVEMRARRHWIQNGNVVIHTNKALQRQSV